VKIGRSKFILTFVLETSYNLYWMEKHEKILKEMKEVKL